VCVCVILKDIHNWY